MLKKMFSDIPVLRRVAVTSIVLVIISVVAMGGIFAYVGHYQTFDREYATRADAIRVTSQSIAKNTREAAKSDTRGFNVLEKNWKTLETNVRLLRDGNPDTNLPPTTSLSSEAARAIELVDTFWSQVDSDVEFVLKLKPSVIRNAQLAEIYRGGAGNGLPAFAERLEKLLIAGSAPDWLIRTTIQLRSDAQELSNHLNAEVLKLATGVGSVSSEVFVRDALSRVQGRFRDLEKRSARLHLSHREARNLMADMRSALQRVNEDATAMLVRTGHLLAVHYYARDVFNNSDRLFDATEKLIGSYQSWADQRIVKEHWGFVAGAFALLFLIVNGLASRRIGQLELMFSEHEKKMLDEEDRRHQMAISTLLDEIGGLRDGDLTVRANVGTEFTGAIADAFNEAIEELHKLVHTINATATSVFSAAKQVRGTVVELSRSSDQQARSIEDASTSVDQMAHSIQQVSNSAQESSRVAEQSVELAVDGARAVLRTVKAMDGIRDKIQETSLRVKRLGDRSQEIGTILELLDDFADQTNYLALNASIQAASAGEAGKGFSVVADEIQRLAERSSTATKEIESLIRSIQADTSETVISMKGALTVVDEGTQLAGHAGDALTKIEDVSNALAVLVEYISNAAKEQSQTVFRFADNMTVIQQITTGTTSGTKSTAVSVNRLTNLASELYRTIARFKLPEKDKRTVLQPSTPQSMVVRRNEANVQPLVASRDLQHTRSEKR